MKLHLTEEQFITGIIITAVSIAVITLIFWYHNSTKPRTKIITRHDPLGFEVDLWTQTFGSSKKPAVLLIHGAGSVSAFWPDHFCLALAQAGYFVIRYDQRDSGYSSQFAQTGSIAEDGPYTFDDLAHDALAILDSYCIQKASIIGHSLGGFLAYHLAAQYPQRCTNIIVIAAGPGLRPEIMAHYKLPNTDPETLKVLYSNHPIGDFSRDYPGWLRSWTILHGELPIEDDRARAYTKELYSRRTKKPGTARNHFATFLTMPLNFPENLSRITMPVLIIHGEKDALIPQQHGLTAHQLIPGSEWKELKRAGHMFFNTQLWDTITQTVIEFLNKHKK